MLDIFVQIFDTIFPPQADIKLLRHENGDDFIRHFTPHRHLDAVALSSYDNPFIRAAITSNKSHDYEPAAGLLASLVNHWYGTLPEMNTAFVAIPLSKERERSRGYNQVKRVLDHSEVKSISLLTRTRHTKPQTSLTRTERFSNMHEAFSADIPKSFSYQRIVIIDDVVTTGATLRAAEAALKDKLPSDCQIIRLALAH